MADHDLICEYCHKQFVKQSAYENHVCDRMRRDQALATKTGQAALVLYETWTVTLKRPKPTSDQFIASKHFLPFLKFVKFSKSVKLPQPLLFIKWAVVNGFPPSMWQYDDVYVKYLTYLDYELDPETLAIQSAKNIISWCEDHEINTSDFLDTATPSQILHMVQMRQLSPWLLMFSKRFAQLLKLTFTAEQKILIESIVRPTEFGQRLEENAEKVPAIKQLIHTLGI